MNERMNERTKDRTKGRTNERDGRTFSLKAATLANANLASALFAIRYA